MSTPHYSVIVIGAGPAGIATAVGLLQHDITDFLLLERAEAVGGTWRDNRYPGVACDVPAHYYSYSFAPNVEATTTFASGAELEQYFRAVAQDRGVMAHVRFDSEVGTLRWDGRMWLVETVRGERLSASVIITAVGRLHRPRYPDIDGLRDFGGRLTHSSRWDPEIDLAGQRLGVIGTGSSAVQILVNASQEAAQLDLFQRTPQWVLPVPNQHIPEEQRQQLRESPDAARKNYYAIEAQIAASADAAVTGDRVVIERRNAMIHSALTSIRDPDLRRKVTPDYEPGCKRLVVSGGYYDAVQRSNVDVIVDAIDRIEPEGIRTVDGVLHPLDVIILATGFHADAFLRPMKVFGADGFDLDRVWARHFVNYKSVAIPHMPNLFTVNGPFSPGGSLSILKRPRFDAASF